MKHMSVPMEIKSIDEKGRLSGYASIFGNVDLGGDIIVKDSPFKEIERNPNGKVLMLYSHDAGMGWTSTAAGGIPVGLADVEQNSKGLKFDGELVMEDSFVAGRLYPGLKAGTICEMSIGYDVLPGGGKVLESGIRELSALKLWEISPVIWGMNRRASIDAVKRSNQVTNIREFEDFLREAGFSKAQAVAIASGGWKTLQDRRDSGDADGAKPILDYLSGLNFS